MKERKHLLISIITIMVLASGLGYYNYYTASVLKQDYNAKVEIISNALVTATNSYNQKLSEVNNNIIGLEDTIDNQNLLFTNMVNALKKENQDKIQSLLKIIEDTEEKNKIKLDELKSDLKGEISNIKVKSADFSTIIDEVIKSVVSVLTDKGQGSGAIITSNGDIITNYHVVESARTVRAVTYDRVLHNAEIIGVDPNSDVAVLRITNTSYPRLRFEPYENVKVGEKVIAVGNPGGFDFTVTEGIVSALNRKASNDQIYIQTDVPINPGNSGGPLINTRGRIIGINNFKVKTLESIGFALNSDTAEDVSNDIIEKLG